MKFRGLFQLPVILSVLAHGLLLIAVTWGWQANNVHENKIYKPRFIEAKLISLEARDTKKKIAAQRKVIDLTKKRAQAKRIAEQKAVKKRKELQKKKLKEKALTEKKRKDQQAKKEREALAEKKRLIQEMIDNKKQEQVAAEQRLMDALANDEAQVAAEVAEVQTQSYVNIITQRIEQTWSRPPSARRGMKCELLIQLVPTGQVVNVTVVKGSGNAAFDRSAEQAVRLVDRFSALQKMPAELFERNFRQLTLVFKPEDLRQ